MSDFFTLTPLPPLYDFLGIRLPSGISNFAWNTLAGSLGRVVSLARVTLCSFACNVCTPWPISLLVETGEDTARVAGEGCTPLNQPQSQASAHKGTLTWCAVAQLGLRNCLFGDGAARPRRRATRVLSEELAQTLGLIKHLVRRLPRVGGARHAASSCLCPLRAWRPHRTVDLVYLLHDFGISSRFLTTTIGVNPEYKNEAFYRTTLDVDSLRVSDLFERAPSTGIDIERRSVSDAELCDLMRPHDSLIMALVDRRYLYRPPSTSVTGFVESCFTQWFSGGYVGHYVLITGFDEDNDGCVRGPSKTAPMFF